MAERRDDEELRGKFTKLYNAVRDGNLDETEVILESLSPGALNWKIQDKDQTALHTAVTHGHVHIVEALVMQMSNEGLAMYDSDGHTALTLAVVLGKWGMVECMLRQYFDLISIRHSEGKNLPVVMAIDFRHIEMARQLYYLTPDKDLIPQDNNQEIRDRNGATLFTRAIYTGTLDIALGLILTCPRLALALDKDDESPILALASIRHSFPSGIQLGFWKQRIYSSCMRISFAPPISDTRLNVSNGEQRQSNQEDQNIISGMIEHSTRVNQIPGAALQMQRELQWFKEVERIVHPKDKETTNEDGLTPRQLFTKKHENMMEKGEKWMKDTARSCTVVGALIVTIMFAAAFTIPGGNNQDTGMKKKSFRVFMVSDALSFFLSSTSVLMFLGILTSRYTEDDFLEYLPRQMIIGLFTLFCSIATMMITFACALLMILHEQLKISIPLICLGGVPVVFFSWIQFPILKDMIISTYGPSIFDRKMKLMKL